MKKTIFFAGAMMLLASVACNKEAQTDNQPSVELKPQVTLSFNAALTTPTKTEIGSSETTDGVTVHQIHWSKDDKIAVYPHNIDSDNPNTKVAGTVFTSEDLTDGSAAEATFTGTVTEADAYYAFYPTSVGATWSEQHNNFSVKLSASQKPNGIASGFAVAEVTGAENVTFNHVCGFVKFTIDKDYAGQIKEVRFSGNNNENLAGNINVTSDGSCNTWGTPDKELILTPAQGETFSEGTYYFTCLPVTLTGGLELTFVDTDDNEATKSSTKEATIERAGVLNLGTVANLEFESVAPILADGTYVILAKKDEVYYAMGSDKYGTSSRLNEVEFDINATTIYDNSLVWSFENTSGVNYKVTNHEGKYLSASSSNTASVKDTETSMVVSDNEDGTYLITTVYNEVTRYLSRNDTDKGFAFYTSTQNNNLYLKAITYVELPKLVAPEIVVTGDDASKSITVTWTDVENAKSYEVVCGEKTQTVDPNVETCTLTMDDYGTYDVTVTAKADGYVSATSEVVTYTLVSEDSKYYVKITEAPADWTGNYLIVYEASATEAYVFNATDATSDYISVGLTSKGILKSNNVDAEIVSIEPMSGGFAIKTKNGYIYGVSGGNALKFNPTEQQVNTISFDSSGNCLIISNEANLNFYLSGGNSRFRYYGKSAQKSIQLYRLQD